jgi:aminomethyltransferase
MHEDTDAPEAPLLESPLHARQEALGAKFSAFGGWSMPLEYAAGVVKEHTAVRTGVGVFDVSHLGKVLVTGPGAVAFVNACLSNDLDRIAEGQAQYTLCCDDATGGIVDDLIAYRYDDERVLLVPNAANTAEVRRRLEEAAPDGVQVADHHQDFAVLAVQGSRSDEVLQAVGLPAGHDYMSFVEAEHQGSGVVVCRTGYTGERGYELVVDNDGAVALWDALMEAATAQGGLPCGLASRDTLRTEMGYPLHGQDISLQVTPNEALLGWAVGWDKAAFWGKARLTTERTVGPRRVLRGVVATQRAIPRPGMGVSLTRDVLLGEVTSGTFSPTLRKGVGLALVASLVKPGTEVGIDVRGNREIFSVVKPPFVESRVREG